MYKLGCRQIEREDLSLLRNWRNRDDIRSCTREHRLLNMVNQEDWFESMSRNRNNEMFIICMDYVTIGVCGLCYIDWTSRNAEISIYIGAENMRHQGIGSKVLEFLKRKAFDEFNLHRVWAEIYSNNPVSIALFEKAGYKLEGRLREHVYKCGEYRDSLMYGLLKDD